METKQDRIIKINTLVHFIGERGRRFFYSAKHDRYAKIERDKNGRIWWHDDHTGKRIYTHCKYSSWRGFSHGGTLRQLVEHFRDFIQTDTQLPNTIFGPWPDTFCNGDLWGYGKENMEHINNEAMRLGILKP